MGKKVMMERKRMKQMKKKVWVSKIRPLEKALRMWRCKTKADWIMRVRKMMRMMMKKKKKKVREVQSE